MRISLMAETILKHIWCLLLTTLHTSAYCPEYMPIFPLVAEFFSILCWYSWIKSIFRSSIPLTHIVFEATNTYPKILHWPWNVFCSVSNKNGTKKERHVNQPPALWGSDYHIGPKLSHIKFAFTSRVELKILSGIKIFDTRRSSAVWIIFQARV